MTKREGAIISAATGILCCAFVDFHQLAEELLERPVFTYEFGSEKVAFELKEKVRPLFEALVANQN